MAGEITRQGKSRALLACGFLPLHPLTTLQVQLGSSLQPVSLRWPASLHEAEKEAAPRPLSALSILTAVLKVGSSAVVTVLGHTCPVLNQEVALI